MKELKQEKKQLYIFFHDPMTFCLHFVPPYHTILSSLGLNSKFYDAPTLTPAYTHMHIFTHKCTYTL